MDLITRLIIGIIAGWLAGQIVRGRGFGVLGDLVLGLVGSWLGGALLGPQALGGGALGMILVSTLGAVVLVALVRLIRRA